MSSGCEAGSTWGGAGVSWNGCEAENLEAEHVFTARALCLASIYISSEDSVV